MGREDWARYDPLRKEAKIPFLTRIPRGMKEELERLAEKNDTSLNGLIVHILVQFLAEQEKKK
jgi:hypothetical protein